MSILLPNQEFGWLRADALELERKMQQGDGIHFSGDPDLFLSQGVVEEMIYGRPTGKIVARSWEVWRHCEDGMDRMIGHWQMHEFDRILFDLATMRAESAAHEDINDVLDKHNAEVEDRLWKPGRDALGNMKEHLAKLWYDKENGKSMFGYGD